MRLASALPVLILAAATTGCAVPPPPPASAPLAEGLDYFGRIVAGNARGEPAVVVIKDRHTTHGSITRSRDVFARIRRENRGALTWLVDKGFTLVGCEAPLGPLSRDPVADRHREAIREALAEGDDLDCFTVYQPIRYEFELAGRAAVLGVEDPELYAEDVRALDGILDAEAVALRGDRPDRERAEALRTSRRLRREISSRVEERGRHAARNLRRLAEETRRPRAVLVMGGAHLPGIVKELEAGKIPYVVFECRSYGQAR